MRRHKFGSLFATLLFLVAVPFVPFCLLAKQHDKPHENASSPAPISHARVVGLNFIRGTVAVREGSSKKWMRAVLEMPIEEGASLVTARDSVAEIEFENGSTLRIGELSRVEFTQLALAPKDGFISHMRLATGVATLHVFSERRDEYILEAADMSLASHGNAEFRTDLNRGNLRVELFHGRIVAANALQSEKLGRNRLLAHHRGDSGFEITNTLREDGWDKWVQQRDREAYLASYNNQSPNGLLYGWDDLLPFGGMGQPPPGIFGDDGF